MPRRKVIAIDGPAGAGKSTVARKLAGELGFVFVDSGAMYRAVALKAMRASKLGAGEEALAKLAHGADIRLDGARVTLDGEDVSSEIRLPEVTRSVRVVADVQGVRDAMVKLQRRAAEAADIVMEGRDITTIVFPDADIKFYLDAKPEVRAGRRMKELAAAGRQAELKALAAEIEKRDAEDKARAIAPLRKAGDAIYVETSGMGIEEAVALLKRMVVERLGQCGA